MKILRHRTPIRSPSPRHPPITDLDELNRLLTRIPERSWSVIYRESSTPPVYPPDYLLQLLQPLEYWKDHALQTDHKIYLLDPSVEHRLSIHSVEYWRADTTRLSKAISDLQREQQERRGTSQEKNGRGIGKSYTECSKEALGEVAEKNSVNSMSLSAQGPISSGLRSRALRADPINQSLPDAAPPRRISRIERQTKTRNKARSKQVVFDDPPIINEK